MFDGGGNTATEIGPLPDMSSPEIEITHHGASVGVRLRALADRAVAKSKAILAHPRHRLYALGGVGAFFLLIIIITIASSGDDGNHNKAIAAGKPSGSDPIVVPENTVGSQAVVDEGPEDIVIETGSAGPTEKTENIVLLTWLYLTAFAFMVGGELNGQIRWRFLERVRPSG